MSEPFPRDDRFGRTIDEQRSRALSRLDAATTSAVSKHFAAAAGPGTDDAFVTDLARRLARDLTAIGLGVSDYTCGAVPGGVWLAPAPDRPGVIVTWTQHDASALALGPRMHSELQRAMNMILFEIIHSLGYSVERYGPCGAHVVTRFRPPLDGDDTPPP